MNVAEIVEEPDIQPLKWTADAFMGLIEADLIEDPRRVELLDGLMIKEMPQGEIHRFIFAALQRVFASMGATQQGLEAMPTVILGADNVLEPEFALLRPESVGRLELPREEDVLWVVEISVTSRRKDLGPKRAAYASARVPHYWVFDGVRRGVWAFSQPVDGVYVREAFFPTDAEVQIPVLEFPLNLSSVFPRQET